MNIQKGHKDWKYFGAMPIIKLQISVLILQIIPPVAYRLVLLY